VSWSGLGQAHRVVVTAGQPANLIHLLVAKQAPVKRDMMEVDLMAFGQP
jgi:hypothetical protein